MTRNSENRPPRQPSARDSDGRRIKLTDLPLVAYTLVCAHHGRAYGVRRNDLVWCEHCRDSKRVVRAHS